MMRTTFFLCLALAFSAAATFLVQQQAFPHEDHAELFPLCEGCHLGISTGDAASSYPEPELCGRCHDGVDEERVEWNGPVATLTNLRFDHAVHALAVQDSGGLGCASCHAAGAGRMDVALTVVTSCFGCHAHRATDHFIDADCATCHVPLASSGLPIERIREFSSPPGHERDDFVAAGHGEQAGREVVSCSMCHTREQCSGCHVNAAAVQEIAAIPAAGAGLEVPRFEPDYPTPASHESVSWPENHGSQASPESCSTCHTRENCGTCHRASPPPMLAQMPARSAASAPGVATLARRAPESHTTPSFTRGHGTLATTALNSCMTCHARETCSTCHERSALSDASVLSIPHPPTMAVADTGRRSRPADVASAFHPPAFMLRHSTAAYGRRLECANCHDVRVFCRDCHTQTGISTAGGSGRLRTAFHDAEPLWLLRHARAARQGLESCTACHTQRDCLQCHSQLGAFRINPHGDDFDARRAAQRNAVICYACHISDPLGGRNP